MRLYLCVWNAHNGNKLRTLTGHEKMVKSVAWSPDSKMIASCGHDGTVRVWDVNTSKVLHTLLKEDEWFDSVAWSSDGSKIAAGSALFLFIGDTSTWNWHEIQVGNEVTSVAWAPGTMLLAFGVGSAAPIWDIRELRQLHTINQTGTVYSIAWSPDCEMLASTDGADVRIWDIRPLFLGLHIAWNDQELLFASRITLLDSLIMMATLKNSDWLKSEKAQILIASRPWYKNSVNKKEDIGTMNAQEVFNLIIQDEIRTDKEYKERLQPSSSL